jgi:hypothetical protein
MDELHRRGHNIALQTLGSQVPIMRERGFDAAPIDPRIEEIAINDYLGRTPFDAKKRAMRAAFASAGSPKSAADAFEAWTRRSGQGPPRESERCSPAATTKMHPTDWIGSKHS